jgi:hypothetical protein
MTTMAMTVSSITLTSKPTVPTREITRERFGYTLIIELFPKDPEFYLKLNTSEVFCNPNQSKKVDDEERISATLSIRQASDDKDFFNNRMLYLDEVETETSYHPSLILFRYFLPAREFGELLTNIRSGLAPSTVEVDLDHDVRDKNSPFTFGSEANGSSLIWANDNAASKKSGIKIHAVSFSFDLLKTTNEHETEHLPQRDSVTEDTAVIQLLNNVRNELRFYGRWIGTAITIIAALILIFVWRR